MVEKKGGKDYYSIAPDYKAYFEFLRDIAGDPVEGTTGRKLPAFDPKWMDIWTGMVAAKIGGWQRKRERALKGDQDLKAKL